MSFSNRKTSNTSNLFAQVKGSLLHKKFTPFTGADATRNTWIEPRKTISKLAANTSCANQEANQPYEQVKLPTSQTWFINKRKQLGKNEHEEGYIGNDSGMCAGVSVEGMMAFLADAMPAFARRYQYLNEIPDESIAAEIEQVRKKMAGWSKRARKTLQAQFDQAWAEESKQLKGNEEKTTIAHINHQKKLVRAIQENIEARQKKYFSTLDAAERLRFIALRDMGAAAETVEIHAQPYYYQELFPEDPTFLAQGNLTALYLMMPKKLEDQGGVALLKRFSGSYNRKELNSYFQSLQNAFEKGRFSSQNPMAIILRSCNHVITVGYNPEKKQWTLINANQLPFKKINDTRKLADEIMQAFLCDRSVAFTSDVYALKKDVEKYQSSLAMLEEDSHWKKIHEMNAAKINQQDEQKAHWLFVAAQNGHTETVKELLARKEINPNLGVFNGATALHIAAQNGHTEIVNRLLEEKNIDIDASMYDSKKGLIKCVKKNCRDKVEKLFKMSHPSLPDEDKLTGLTSLHAAVLFGHTDIVKSLLKNGADTTKRADGISVREMAEAMGNRSILQLLSSHEHPSENAGITTQDMAKHSFFAKKMDGMQEFLLLQLPQACYHKSLQKYYKR